VASPIKKLKSAIKMTEEDKSWGLVRMCKTAKLYEKLTKATQQHTIIVTKNPRLWKNDWRK